jgi:hypothetical protein
MAWNSQIKGTLRTYPFEGNALQGTFWKPWGAGGRLVVNMAKCGDLAWVQNREVNVVVTAL